jgi:hypothetical protein
VALLSMPSVCDVHLPRFVVLKPEPLHVSKRLARKNAFEG